MKKITSIFIAIMMLFAVSVQAFALEPVVAANPAAEPVFGDPIQVITYVDENGNDVVERIYFAPEPGSEGFSVSANGAVTVAAETSGRGWYQKEKELANSDTAIMYVKAYFVWGNGDVSVSNASGWHEGIVSATEVSNESVTTGTGRFALIFNKYAYAEYYFITTNIFGVQQGNSVKVTVSESGNVS